MINLSPRIVAAATMAGMILALLLGLMTGPGQLTLTQTLQAVAGLSNDDIANTIIWQVRLPRLLVAALCGAWLAAAGVLSQGLFRNSLASPSIIGTTAGAGLAAAAMFFLGAQSWHWLSLPAASLLGALVPTAIVLYLGGLRDRPTLDTLLLLGFALSALLGAGTALIVNLMLSEYQQAAALLQWQLGGFSARGYEHIGLLLTLGLPALILARIATGRLNIFTLGEDVARTLSVDPRRLRYITLAAIALLTGAAVAVAGPVPFIGLIVPHITRQLAGVEHRRLLWLSACNGATLAVVADLLARTVRAPAELEVGTITSIIGAPFFIYLLLDRRRQQTERGHG